MKIKKSLLTASAGLVAVFGFALTSQSASARVVCNDHGDCWHTSERISYPPDLHVRVYNDRFRDQRYRDRAWRRYHRTWHDENHEHDHGAWRNGVWITF